MSGRLSVGLRLDDDGDGLDDAESNTFSSDEAVSDLTDTLVTVEERVFRASS